MPVNTGSILDSKTRTSLSTQVLIYVNGEPVGAVQSLQIQQSRPLKAMQEVGTDGIIEIVPSGATTYSISLVPDDTVNVPGVVKEWTLYPGLVDVSIVPPVAANWALLPKSVHPSGV